MRTHSMVRQLGAELVEVRPGGGRLVRYARSLLRTVRAVHSRRPEIVIATNPSIVLGCALLLLRPFYGFKLVSDAHYVGVQTIGSRPILQWLLDRHNRAVDLVIVTNEGHARYLEAMGARPFICPDPLPALDVTSRSQAMPSERAVLLICSFDDDEPYLAAFEAFKDLHAQGYRLWVSGNFRRAGVDVSRYPWVRFLGFLSDAEYQQTLASCDVVMDLTTLENCLVCGAYEAIALGKPLILSDTQALRAYFGSACVLTSNDPDAIAASVREAFARLGVLSTQVQDWAAQSRVDMSERIRGLHHRFEALSLSTAADHGRAA
jgi:glycosyltransferase involved in cell wall biosynthesis